MVERVDRRAVEEGFESCGLVALPEEVDARCSHLRRGWYWGSQSFAERMRKLAEKKLKRTKSRAYRSAAVRQTHGLEQAQRWLQEGLEAAGLAREDLSRVRGSDPRKVSLAELLWSRTTVTQEWLAENLQMRSAANVSQLLRRAVVKRRNRQVPSRFADFINRAIQAAE
jgi:hypothetical protein